MGHGALRHVNSDSAGDEPAGNQPWRSMPVASEMPAGRRLSIGKECPAGPSQPAIGSHVGRTDAPVRGAIYLLLPEPAWVKLSVTDNHRPISSLRGERTGPAVPCELFGRRAGPWLEGGMMVPRARQITALLKNSPGELAKLCEAFHKVDVNITALMVVEGRARIMVDDSRRAGEVLENMGISYSSAEVIVLEIPDKPGAVADVANKMGKAGINIDYAFASTVPGRGTATVVFAVSDVQKAESVVE